MNKPAPKEPSMDEILSSIRQIIADDDASAVRKPATPPPAPPSPPRSFAPVPPRPEPAAEPEPLALSAEQILRETAAADEKSGTGVSFSELIGSETPEPQVQPQPVGLVDPDDIAFDPSPEPVAPLRPAPTVERPRPAPVSNAAPLPDPRLTSDMAEQLLEPATQSVIGRSFSKLSSLSTVATNVTVEDIMRDLLRPMLKEWLDENLPAMVERMVEQEIARVSRGGR
jgi:cell pole-organizing protein PopZ